MQGMAERVVQQTQRFKGIRRQVMISFLFSCLFHSVCGQLQYSIFEEMQKGATIGNIANDLGLNIKEIAARKFRIDSQLSKTRDVANVGKKVREHVRERPDKNANDRIDREALCGATEECFLTFDAVIENPLNIFHVRIDIKDINDNPPRFIQEKTELEISEATSPGTKFILQNAEDMDLGIHSILTYKLGANKHFALGEKKGTNGRTFPELILQTSLDRETQSNHELILTVSDSGIPVQTGTTLIMITVTDFNDNVPIFTQEVYKVNIHENIPIHSTVLHVNASDKDEGVNAQITYSFSTTATNVLRKFTINSKTGEITTKGNVDFEEVKYYDISVQAQDGGGLVSHTKVLIQIMDENDNAPHISVSSITNPISEDSPTGTVVALIKAHDLDSGENGEVDCEIIVVMPFKLLSSFGNFYKIITTSSLDREKTPHHNITIQAKDKGSPPLSSLKTIRLDVLDINDNPPEFEKSSYVAYVTENNQPGASIYTTVTLTLVVSDNFQHVIPEVSNQSRNSQSNVQIYLVIAIALISFLFMLTVMLGVISKYRESKMATSLSSMATYPQIDHNFIPKFNIGTLPLPYSYDVCVTLDPSERNFPSPSHNNVPVENLIDADDADVGIESVKGTAPTGEILQVSY
ncbi:hypothetical protein XELAEV_18021585mg [Xenopus laevis]|uniref:Cadherin domain-containing protein n=1 Tax=Xenopus laevis TaxID=8355 RepID=A0A974D9U4_XENLA|nr:hypothetical protein XELAEV_18021585mg [Xenopus laevis]